MKNLWNGFVNFCAKILCFWASLWPRQFLRFQGKILGFLWFDVLRLRRQVIFDNLEIAFPGLSQKEKIRIGRRSVYELGAGFAEFFSLPSIDQVWLQKHATYEGLENFQKAHSKGRGVYLLSLHLGNGDMGASLISLAGIDVSLISKFFRTQWFNDLWFRIRRSQGVKFIEPHGRNTPFEILKAIKNKGSVIFVLDQFMGRPFGLPTRFFGRETGTAYGLALFYLKTESPVVPVYTFEGSDHRVHLVFEPELELKSFISEDKDKTLTDMTQYFNDQIEALVRRYPEQWMWVHRRWKEYE